jgi:hypothetical protein
MDQLRNSVLQALNAFTMYKQCEPQNSWYCVCFVLFTILLYMNQLFGHYNS